MFSLVTIHKCRLVFERNHSRVCNPLHKIEKIIQRWVDKGTLILVRLFWVFLKSHDFSPFLFTIRNTYALYLIMIYRINFR